MSSTEKAGFVEDVVDIFISPAAVYERRRDASLWPPFLFVSIALGLIYYLTAGAMLPIMEAEYVRGSQDMIESGRLTAEQMAQGRKFAETFGMVTFIAGTPLAIFFCGIGLLLTGKLVDANLKLGVGTMIAAWAFVPRVIGSVITAVQLRFLQPESLDGFYRLSLGPARFMDPDTASPFLLAIAGRFDLFILWTTMLIGIGVSVVARVSRSSGMIAAVGVWLLGSFFALYGTLR